MVSEFQRFLAQVDENHRKAGILSPYFFVSPGGYLKGKPYTHAVMSKIWKAACAEAGETISMYAGLKHSSCSQFLNEKGGSYSELQSVTDHKRLESVKRYGSMDLQRRKELMERKVIVMSHPLPKAK